MKKNLKLIISSVVVIILITTFLVVNNSIKNKRLAEEKRKQDIEIQNKLSELKVKPVIQESTWAIVEDKDDKKTEWELTQEEEAKILTFTSASQCDQLVYLKDKCKDRFLFTLSTKSNNLSYCDRLWTDKEKTDCRDEINNNLGNCSSIVNTYLKSKCESNMKSYEAAKKEQVTLKTAIQQTNANLCKTLSTYNEKETCAINIIEKNYDISICNSLFTTKIEQDKCIKNATYLMNRAIINEAYTKKNLSLCDKLTDENLKKQCKSMTF